MRGRKRAGVSESFPEANQSPFKNAKPVEGTMFGTTQHSSASLDKQRAELARKHVRAVNNQFVSWVQMQLKNHPDELWEDGMNDYISHASNILEKFKDVVNWLKQSKGRGDNVSPESTGAEKKQVGEVENNYVKPASNNSLFASNTQPGIFSTNQSSNFSSSPFGLASNSQTGSFSSGQFGLAKSNSQPSFSFSNNQNPFSSGVTPVSIPTKRDSPEDADGEDEEPQPSSPSVRKTEEKGVTVVHEVKCKLYVKSNDPTDKGAWKDKGTGNLCIKCKEGVDEGTKESKPTILVRNDVGKLLLNALLYAGIKTSAQKNALVAIFHSSEDSNENVTPRTFLIRTKTAEARDKLATAIQEYAPSS
ncbi:hypothetical protein F2Q70_00017154 [Brassica cretica]|uniref:RanBD1 domain-containing protein n=1 Tax=Brassica cretica TaxID=69181 RepID=A0A3N6SSH2_BRACR|nr:hypothetical protein F2Q70_00017154 [Brassica cretica]KAF2600803.1 hypothetical protein F2Q68_00010105 [Brassica cretica]